MQFPPFSQGNVQTGVTTRMRWLFVSAISKRFIEGFMWSISLSIGGIYPALRAAEDFKIPKPEGFLNRPLYCIKSNAPFFFFQN